MSADKPDYHDADLALRLYEMRREARTRENRDKLNFGFWPKSYDEVKAILQPDHPLNAAWRQLGTYWEMVYGLARNGIVNAEYLAETNGEGFFLFAKVSPYLDQLRKDSSPMSFRSAEWLSENSKTGKMIFERFRSLVAKRLESA